MRSLGIDIGTTTISAVVVDMKDRTVAEAVTVPNNCFIPTPNQWERIQDAGAIIGKAKALVDGLLEKHRDIAFIGLTGQMHGILYLDREGHPVSPLYTWQDGRGSLPYGGEKSLTVWLKKRLGVETSVGYGLVTHIYNVENGLVPNEGAALCTIADHLGMVLTGRKKPLMHVSNAASLGFFDCVGGGFKLDALKGAGVEDWILPEVTKEVSILGAYRKIPVGVGIGDNQASFLGAAWPEEKTALVNMGTGGQISVLSPGYFTAPGIEARPMALPIGEGAGKQPGEGCYLLVGASLCGGRAYAILEQFFRSYVKLAGGDDKPQYDVMQKLALAGAKKREGAMLVAPLFQGTRANPEKRGSISNISEDNFTPEGMVYGMLLGMANELYEMYRQIEQGTGIRVERLVASGNGLRKNPVLQDIFREVFRVGLSLSPVEEEAACGAAFSGGVVCGG